MQCIAMAAAVCVSARAVLELHLEGHLAHVLIYVGTSRGEAKQRSALLQPSQSTVPELLVLDIVSSRVRASAFVRCQYSCVSVDAGQV